MLHFVFFAGQSSTLRLLLSFAVGGLLGDVFLHLLPEAWSRVVRLSGSELHQQRLHLTTLGLWILLGIFTFVVVEIIFIKTKDDSSDSKVSAVKNFLSVAFFIDLLTLQI